MNLLKELHRGLIKENAVFVLLLGMCPTLAVTGSAMNGLGMGLASTAVLLGSNMVISLIKNLIPDKVRIPVFIVIIASFVTIIDLIMAAYTPDLHEELGIFIPLIVVNCVILGRAEAFASKNSFLASLVDGFVMGLGFTFALTLLGSVREILGAGSLFNWKFVSEDATTILLFILQPGAFIALGFLIAFVNKLTKKKIQGGE
ncbi:MAG: electron transport complex subunit E [Candidatus Aminicenantes bacterium]|jgi:electron transport complex protein RnfE|nr:electron transport complex subunit E [Candidatus Aminicenantes bacterium]